MYAHRTMVSGTWTKESLTELFFARISGISFQSQIIVILNLINYHWNPRGDISL
jgi:hypothetical protein